MVVFRNNLKLSLKKKKFWGIDRGEGCAPGENYDPLLLTTFALLQKWYAVFSFEARPVRMNKKQWCNVELFWL